MYGTPIYVWENGKVVAKDPTTMRIRTPNLRRKFPDVRGSIAEIPRISWG
jgi:hypothetical protein